jgi:hypothetical protein
MEHVDLLAKLRDFPPPPCAIFAFVFLVFIFIVVVHRSAALRFAAPAWTAGGAEEMLHRTGVERLACNDNVNDLRGALRRGMLHCGMSRHGGARMSESERVRPGAARMTDVFGAAARMTGMRAAMLGGMAGAARMSEAAEAAEPAGGLTGMGPAMLGVMLCEARMRPLMVATMMFAARFASFIG